MLSPFISEYVRTLDGAEIVNVSKIFESSRLERRSSEARFQFLERMEDYIATFQVPIVNPLDRIRSQSMMSSFNGVTREVDGLFSNTNDLSLVLDNYSTVLESNLVDLENEMNEMEKTMESFGGAVGADEGASFIWLDSFSDSSRQDLSLSFVPDRDGVGFSPKSFAEIDPESGFMSIPDDETIRVVDGANAKVVNSNFPIDEAKKDLSHLLNPESVRSWVVKHRSSQRLSDDKFVDENGAKVKIRIRYPTPVLANKITIQGYARNKQRIASLVVHGVGGLPDTELATKPIALGKSRTITFPTRPIQTVTLVLRQSTFRRAIKLILPEQDKEKRRKKKRKPAPPPPRPKKKVAVRSNTGATTIEIERRPEPSRRPGRKAKKCPRKEHLHRGRCIPRQNMLNKSSGSYWITERDWQPGAYHSFRSIADDKDNQDPELWYT